MKVSGFKSGGIELCDMVFFNSGFFEVIITERQPSEICQINRAHCNLHKAMQIVKNTFNSFFNFVHV
jgi:hypothetical protein